MSEKVYAWLLCLFPKEFRETYGREALQLFRDRSHNERGFVLRLRLWSDLVADLLMSLPSQHYRGRTSPNEECLSQKGLSSPRFQLLMRPRIRPVFLLFGSAVTLVAQTELLYWSSAPNATLSVRSVRSLPNGVVAFPERPDPDCVLAEKSRGVWQQSYLSPGASAGDVSTAVGEGAAFETVSIRPARSTDPRDERLCISPNGDLRAQTVSLVSLLAFAYDVPANPSSRISGLPRWSLERYDIEAKAAPGAFPSGVSGVGALHRAQHMMRGLLTRRFALELIVEQKKTPVYALSVAKEGPKLQESDELPGSCVFDTDPAGCHNFVVGFGHPLRGRAVDMDDLAYYIENWSDLPVVNRTGLTKLYTLDTRGWRPMRLPPPPPGSIPDPKVFATLPTIFTVLADLGLTMERKEATVAVYQIERIEQPDHN